MRRRPNSRPSSTATATRITRRARRYCEKPSGADVPIYAHENADAPLREAADPDLPPPTSTFAETMTLADGEIELHYLGRSHSDDMAVAFLPVHGLAFAVDFVSRDRFGYQDLASFHFPDMFGAIEGLLEIPFETIVFGHGPSGDRATIERQLTYYRDLDAAVRDAVEEGLSEDETAATVLLEDYSHWDRYDDWRELNVRGMHRKLSAAGVGEDGEEGEHGEGGEEGEGEHGEGREGRGEHDREGRESRGEHDGNGGEHDGEGGHGEGEEGEESGEYLGRAETWDATRRGARLVLSYDPARETFAGTVENTTAETLCAVRVEVHLSIGHGTGAHAAGGSGPRRGGGGRVGGRRRGLRALDRAPRNVPLRHVGDGPAGPSRDRIFVASQWVPCPLGRTFEFFSAAHNLERIIPPLVGFRILTPAPIEMRKGTQIDYRLRLRGVALRWRSEMTRWDPPHGFVDEQRRGPYRKWIHEHRFREEDGGTRVEDHVTYAVPGGALVDRWFVRPDLDRIFEYRRHAIAELFRG